jgi:hypothetical protein
MDIILKTINRVLSLLQTQCDLSNMGSEFIYTCVFVLPSGLKESCLKSVTYTGPSFVLAPSEVHF